MRTPTADFSTAQKSNSELKCAMYCTPVLTKVRYEGRTAVFRELESYLVAREAYLLYSAL